MFEVYFRMDDGSKILVAIQPTMRDTEHIIEIQLEPDRYSIEEKEDCNVKRY